MVQQLHIHLLDQVTVRAQARPPFDQLNGVVPAHLKFPENFVQKLVEYLIDTFSNERVTFSVKDMKPKFTSWSTHQRTAEGRGKYILKKVANHFDLNTLGDMKRLLSSVQVQALSMQDPRLINQMEEIREVSRGYWQSVRRFRDRAASERREQRSQR